MHITEVRIAGFKSFVDPQDLPIEPGLTGIVGPNGCGKSNLLEALRWAMGASSARAMRGGEMDDLIFSGSSERPARETAEVTLILDNTKRTAPAEFNGADQLEVLRRLKRGSGSTYKLNGRTVRGKDIQLLFADASTGANSPALVRQGQISELIGAKPQNRRRILEEAAGIAGLNSRRHEAELKLRGAETNLERLTEVSAEVERQLESLKRQARKARKYKALAEEITALEAFIAHLRWIDAKAGLDAARSALEEAKRAVEERTRADAIAEKHRIEAGEGLSTLRDTESLAAAKLGQARIALAKLETERQAALQAAQRLSAETERLEEDIAREQDSEREAREAIERAKAELAALPVEDESQSASQEAEARTALEAARAALRAAETEADAAQAKVSEARANRRAADANADAQHRRTAQLKADIERYQGQLASVEDATSLDQALQATKTAEDQAELALHDAERAMEAAEEALYAARNAETETEAPRTEARKALSTLEAEIAGLRRLLRKAEGLTAPPVIERIRTRDGYEKAVAAAIGDDLQAPTDRQAALHWAGAGAAGQSLPQDAAPLTEFVDAPGELTARLSQCGVVDASRGAQLAQQLQPGQRLVSVEGHLWRWDGFTRTPDAPVSAAARLEQQARLDAALLELAPAKAAVDAAEAAYAQAAEARTETENTLRIARASIAPLSQTLKETRTAHAAARQSAERAALKRDSAEEALSRAENELRTAQDTLSRLTPQTSDQDETALEATLDTVRNALAGARTTEVEARGRLTDLTHGREQAALRREALQRDLETWSSRANAASERLTLLLDRRKKVLAEAETVRAQPAALEADLNTRRAHVDSFEQARRDAADALAKKEAAAREAETAAREASAAAASARETLAGGKVRLETAEARYAESVEIARHQFGRTPEGLHTLALAGLESDALENLPRNEAEARVDELKRQRDALGGVNMDAEEEAEELAERMGAQAAEKADLLAAIAKLHKGVDVLNAEGRDRLLAAFDIVNEHFQALFTTLFRGGQAELKLVDADDPLAAGLEIMAQPPGKRLGTLNLMSGGEQALTAAALIFAVFLSRPAPICVLDEVDAPLDDANVDRFCRMLDEMRNRTDTRFVIITHNPVTMSRMDRLFGVTMREKGVSKLVSVDLGAAEDLVAA